MSASENPLPPMSPPRRALLDFFSRALSSFQHSSSKFQVICTIPPARRDHDRLPVPTPPSTRPRTLVVLDSSFNPPTIAHLRMAASALHDLTKSKRKDLGAVRLLLLLAVNNADKAPKPAPFDQRLALMWAFAKDIQSSSGQGSIVSEEMGKTREQEEGWNIDIALSTQPYFHEKSAAIAQSDFYEGSQNDKEEVMEQVILAGYDTLIRIFNPKYYGPPTSPARSATPIQKALDPFFSRAKLRVTLRTDDEWGGKEDQLAYLQGVLTGEGLRKVGGSQEWGRRIEMVEGRKKRDVRSGCSAEA
ncbi:hypothetical protein QBC37DRAFT_438816 [Rhypophila decipiens]|uniref:Nicotinamide-nucleotide adenylyltransferase n=1 Tax=Rhypophila decipiens TaxID=261697 RepID=A0AAN6YDC3_9PEZI|nr:hypothetical protein QBC37DRAFT_438816 [Rhypophila decipiens]